MYTSNVQRRAVEICAAAALVLVRLPIASAQSTHYVNAACGNDAWSGASAICQAPDGPKATIQAGIDAAVNGDEVVVVDGTYTGPGNRDIDFGGRAIIVGSENGLASCIIDCQASAADPHRGFHFHSGETADSVLEGFTVRNGFMHRGGAILCQADSSPAIRECVFTQNSADAIAERDGGGAVYILDSSPTYINCQFIGNHVTVAALATGGGGMFSNNSSPTLTGCEFRQNTIAGPEERSGGGGLHSALESRAVLTDCKFTENNASGYGGGVANGDGAQITLTSCTFLRNQAGAGGAMINRQAAATLIDCEFRENFAVSPATGDVGAYLGFSAGTSGLVPSTSTFINCRFVDNRAARCCGGMAIVDGSEATFINCTFIGNTAMNEAGGGGVVQRDARVTLTNCLFVRNSSLAGDGLWLGDSATANVVNCTFGPNAPSSGGGGIYAERSAVVNLANSIVWGNTPSQIRVFSESVANITYSDVQGGYAGVGNINADPLFVDSGAGDYYLAIGSPCIDAASNAAVPPDAFDLDGDADTAEPLPFDLDGNPRLFDDPSASDTGNGPPPIVDMGVFERHCVPGADSDGDGVTDCFDACPNTEPGAWIDDRGCVRPGVRADLDFNGVVDDQDLGLFILCGSGPAIPHNGTPTCRQADFDDDNDVDQADFGRWQRCYSGQDNPADPNCAE